jgi:hypothetical protein
LCLKMEVHFEYIKMELANINKRLTP